MIALTAAPAGSRPPDWLLRQLPVGLLSEDFFVRFVSLFQAEAETLLSHADNLPHLADPRVAPPAMVRHMASWIGLPDGDADETVARQRERLTMGAQALRWRGTSQGLADTIEALTGSRPDVLEGGGVVGLGQIPADSCWVEIRVADTGPLSAPDFVSLIRDEVPAHVRCHIWVAGEQLWPTPSELVSKGPLS